MKGGNNNKVMAKKSKKKKNFKVASSILLGLLMVSGGVLAMPVLSADNSFAQLQNSVNAFEKNPERFLQTNDLGLKSGFQEPSVDISCLPENNIEKYFSTNEGDLEKALRNKDYKAWKKAVNNLDESLRGVDTMSEEDFQILALLHQPSNTSN